MDLRNIKFAGQTPEEITSKLLDCSAYIEEVVSAIRSGRFTADEVDSLLVPLTLPKLLFDTAYRGVRDIIKERIEALSGELKAKAEAKGISIAIPVSETRS